MGAEGFAANTIFSFGSITITSSIITTWVIMIFLIILAYFFTYRLKLIPKTPQNILESIIMVMHNAIQEVLPEHVNLIFPFISSLWIFILISNLIGIIPLLNSPTSDFSVTSALAILTFLSVHWYGIKVCGFKNYLSHYIKPSFILLPFHLVSEVSRTLAMAVRLFGNMMSLQFTALLILMIMGFLVPVPILMLHIVEAIIQAYIFGMLALVYIAGGIQIQEEKIIKKKELINE